MNVWDMMDAVGNVKEKFIEEMDPEKTEIRSVRVKKSAWMKIAAACLIVFVTSSVSVVAADFFSSIKGDELAFECAEYLGDGKVAIRVRNDSDKLLRFQEDVKLCTFYGNQEFEQRPGGSVRMEGNVVKPHSSSELLVDLSEVYDMEEVANTPLEDDWYYLVLTNDRFLIGQDWHCAIDFEEKREMPAEFQVIEEVPTPSWEQIEAQDFWMEGWQSPLKSLQLAHGFGLRDNGSFADVINLAGEPGEDVFAVDSAEVADTGYESRLGNYVLLQLKDGVEVKYGHLKEICVEKGQTVASGEKIGTLGATGMATGPNLALQVFVEGEAVDPLK